MNRAALHGIRILELDNGIVQYAGKMLADMGAEVIKIEPPDGSPARKIGPYYKDTPHVNYSLSFWHYNTSKKSMTLNLATEDGRNIFQQLLKDSDVVIDGLGHGELAKFDLKYEELSKQHPHLIYVKVTPFGMEGPWSNYLSSDIVQLALGGVMGITGYDDLDEPLPIAPTGGQAAHLTSLMTGISVLAALHAREQTGAGDHVDISSHDVISTSLELPLPIWEAQKAIPIRHTGRHAFAKKDTPRWVFKCKDGKHIMALTTYLTDKRYELMVQWFDSYGLAEDLSDEKFKDGVYRQANLKHIAEVIGRFCSHHTSDYIFHQAQKIRLPWGPVNAPEDLLDDPHLTEDRKAFVPVDHPEINETFLYPGAPYQFHATPWQIHRRAPQLGEHTEEILQQLGVNSMDYRLLVDSGAV